MKMADEIIRELWRIKDQIAEEYGWDLKALVAYLQTKKHVGNEHVVEPRNMKHTAEQGTQTDRRQQGTL